MDDNVSVYNGVKPEVVGTATWEQVLENIRDGKYKSAIEKGRKIKDPVKYREFKTKLPAVTFPGRFNGKRAKDHIISTTGFIVADLDHLKNVDTVFNLLTQDDNIWFAFRSPSGEGIKAGVRSNGIKTDDDVKKQFEALEYYFQSGYGIKIDPACKDIARLSFLSYDPDLFVHPTPQLFDINFWKPVEKDQAPLPDAGPMDEGWKARYGQKVLESCCSEIANSEPGHQHHVRLRRARLVGGYIPTGFINEAEAISALRDAVRASGAKKITAAMKTIKDGIEYGKASPIEPEQTHNYKPKKEPDYYCDPSEIEPYVSNVSGVSKVSESGNLSASVSGCKQDVSKCKQDSAQKPPYSLAGYIKEWVINSSGSFTVDQLDREFCLTTRKDKNNRSACLHRLINLDYIKRDRRIKGKYQVIDRQLDLIDLNQADDTPFPIHLPFGLHNHIIIPQKSIIVIAGTSNAGKTALALNMLRMNIKQRYRKLYLMSEMGPGEYKSRIRSFEDIPLQTWQDNILAAEKSYDFDGAVKGHNPDGLTCIDFLEEVEGEYFKIASDIRDIYDSLGNGVVAINIQKKTGADFGRGGEATIEKSRLYLTIDHLVTKDHSVICSAYIRKLKRPRGRNIQHSVLHFEISNGSIITPLMDWTPSYKVNIDKCIREYRGTTTYDDGFLFQTQEGEKVRINYTDAAKWQRALKNIDVKSELKKISENSYKNPFLKKTGYFFQIFGILKKVDEKKLYYIDGDFLNNANN